MTTTEKIRLYEDALFRWLKAGRDYSGLHNPEPTPADYQLDEWTAGKVKERVQNEFKRTI